MQIQEHIANQRKIFYKNTTKLIKEKIYLHRRFTSKEYD
ncbi:hypothetical protein QUO_1542 [Clostridioides difficile P64]|nr:hypothetical protein QUO_2700 [Clostridioides difficile P64]ERM37668.1 hypothetical protein QUO_2374 [Clostridioides difficile P64]ERM38091.1 hypothetical protein QUO_1943 [Clostridioides difficile P64]ERM38154.1 hypothetical protein QUO_1826 [Clostridioides difficile P64]ERM38479.1 hypothetical protein QUO_1542 [Clostridioides difficile P64]